MQERLHLDDGQVRFELEYGDRGCEARYSKGCAEESEKVSSVDKRQWPAGTVAVYPAAASEDDGCPDGIPESRFGRCPENEIAEEGRDKCDSEDPVTVYNDEVDGWPHCEPGKAQDFVGPEHRSDREGGDDVKRDKRE
jgi:hypothetical protein